ncbi:hypothetical protein [Flavobacterium sp. W20_MBD1_R3]|uniref:hypothetical protein n=1 Tax=Flavobacterium sp. W20_MBD1_R3 TaxID=3240278 RepID=UPI003F901456
MEKDSSAQNNEYFKELKRRTIQQKIDLIESDDLEHTFRGRYGNEIFLHFFDRLKPQPLHSFHQQIKDLFENANTIKGRGYDLQPDFFDFYKSERAELETFINGENNNSNESRTKAIKYLQYLNEDGYRWWRIDALFELMGSTSSYPSIAPLANAKLKKEFINIKKLDTQQSELFRIIDHTHLLTLLSAENRKKRATYIGRFPTWFDFDYYKDPFIFAEFPKDKNTFHKVLKSWIMDQVETRKKIFEWDEIPPEYQYLLDYANNLLQQTAAEKIQKTDSPKPVKIMTISSLEYPRHIFADAKAYELFSLLMRHVKSLNATSFVFRTMAEKENPQLIVVNDTPFRTWFNTQGYPIKLENHTKTYENAKNEDRIVAYNIAKELITKL